MTPQIRWCNLTIPARAFHPLTCHNFSHKKKVAWRKGRLGGQSQTHRCQNICVFTSFVPPWEKIFLKIAQLKRQRRSQPPLFFLHIKSVTHTHGERERSVMVSKTDDNAAPSIGEHSHICNFLLYATRYFTRPGSCHVELWTGWWRIYHHVSSYGASFPKKK